MSIDRLRQRAIKRIENVQLVLEKRRAALSGTPAPAGGTPIPGEIADARTASESANKAAEDARARVSAAEADHDAAQRTALECRATGAACTLETQAHAEKSEALARARIDLVSRDAEARRALDAVAVKQAELDQLGGRAAELVHDVLEEYRQDLNTLQLIVESENVAPAEAAGTPSLPTGG